MTDKKSPDQSKPPLLSSWNAWYTLVLATLVFLIIVFYGIMRFFE